MPGLHTLHEIDDVGNIFEPVFRFIAMSPLFGVIGSQFSLTA
jgi:hypothetical protein